MIVETNDSAVRVLSSEMLWNIVRELIETKRNYVLIAELLREYVCANLRRLVKRVLREHGYRLDKQKKAIRTEREQIEDLSAGWATCQRTD